MSTLMECSICLEVFSSDNTLICNASCGHLFHAACLSTWMRQGRHECPFCRREHIDIQQLFPNFTERDQVANQGELEAAQLEIRMWRGRANSAHQIDHLRIWQAQTQRENERLRNQPQRDLELLQEQYDMLHTQNRLQVTGLLQDISQLQGQVELAQAEVNTLREQVRRHAGLEMEMTDVRRLNDCLKQEAGIMRSLILQIQGKAQRPTYADDKVSIRNLPATVMTDPRARMMRVFARLDIECVSEDFNVLSCGPMIAYPDRYQATLEFANKGLKLDLVTRAGRIKLSSRAARQRLQIRDAVEAAVLHKRLVNSIYGRKGVTSVHLTDSQVLIQLAGEASPREVEDEDNLKEIVELLPCSSRARTGAPPQ